MHMESVHQIASSLRKTAGWIRGNESGGLLVEVVVTMVAFGLIGTTVLSSIQTSAISKRLFDVSSTSEHIVRNQLEYVLQQPYQAPPAD